MKEIKQLCMLWAIVGAVFAAVLLAISPLPWRSITGCLVLSLVCLAGAAIAEWKESRGEG